jgi:hypothetical protein
MNRRRANSWCIVLIVILAGPSAAAEPRAVRGGVPSTIHYFEEAVPVMSGATRGCITGTAIDEHHALDEAEIAGEGSCAVPLDYFHLTFTAFGKPFELLVIGRAPTNEPRGPECFAPGQVPQEAEDRLFFHRHDGSTCRRTATSPTSFAVRANEANSHGRLLLRDGEWWGSVQVGGDLYVLRPRSLYDSAAPLGTVIIYRYSDSDEF